MSLVTAIILSKEPIPYKTRGRVPPGIEILNFISDIPQPRAYQTSWQQAIKQVRTPYFFFLDDDDFLPTGFASLLMRILSTMAGKALAYTNELIINSAGVKTESIKQPYSQDVHIQNPGLCHHLVVGRTDAALRAISVVPLAGLQPEVAVYFQMAKEGAVWIDEIGYHWHKGEGLHSQPGALTSQLQAQIWCGKNKDLPSPVVIPTNSPLSTPPAPVDPGLAPYKPTLKRKRKQD